MNSMMQLSATVSNASLPATGNITAIPTDELALLLKFAAQQDYLDDKSGHGVVATIDPANNNFSFADGILTAAPIAGGVGRSALQTGVFQDGIAATKVLVVRFNNTTGSAYLLRHPSFLTGVNLIATANASLGLSVYYKAADDSNQNPSLAITPAPDKTAYHVISIASDADGWYLSVDGAPFTRSAWLGGGLKTIPSGNAASQVVIGCPDTANSAPLFDLAAFAHYARKITDVEMLKVYCAFKTWMTTKNVIV